MPRPTIFSYTIEDESGDKATTSLYVSYDAATETVGALLGAAAVYGGLIDAVTAGKIVEFNVSINALPDPNWKQTAAADSDVQKTLLTNFTITDTIYKEEVIVPAVAGSLIDANGHPVVSGGAIKALADGIVAAQGGVSAQSAFLLDLTGLANAAITFRKRKDSRKLSKVKP